MRLQNETEVAALDGIFSNSALADRVFAEHESSKVTSTWLHLIRGFRTVRRNGLFIWELSINFRQLWFTTQQKEKSAKNGHRKRRVVKRAEQPQTERIPEQDDSHFLGRSQCARIIISSCLLGLTTPSVLFHSKLRWTCQITLEVSRTPDSTERIIFFFQIQVSYNKHFRPLHQSSYVLCKIEEHFFLDSGNHKIL